MPSHASLGRRPMGVGLRSWVGSERARGRSRSVPMVWEAACRSRAVPPEEMKAFRRAWGRVRALLVVDPLLMPASSSRHVVFCSSFGASARCGPSVVPTLPKFAPLPTYVGPTSTNFGRLRPHSADLDHIRAVSGRSHAIHGPNFDFSPDSNWVEFGPGSTNFGPTSTKFCRCRPKLGRILVMGRLWITPQI